MNIATAWAGRVVVGALVVLLVQACAKEASTSGAAPRASDSRDAGSIKIGERYRSLKSHEVVLITDSEIEVRIGNEATVGAFTKPQPDTIRAVFTVLGTQRALYFKVTNEGLVAQDGEIFYTAKRYAEVYPRWERLQRIDSARNDLFRACKSGTVDEVRTALEELTELEALDSDFNSLDADGLTPLMYAVRRGDANIVACLLAQPGGVDVDTPGLGGTTALMLAARSKQGHKIAGMLIESGANFNQKDETGKTPLMHGVEAQNARYFAELMRRGADPELRNAYGQDVFEFIYEQGKKAAGFHGVDGDAVCFVADLFDLRGGQSSERAARVAKIEALVSGPDKTFQGEALGTQVTLRISGGRPASSEKEVSCVLEFAKPIKDFGMNERHRAIGFKTSDFRGGAGAILLASQWSNTYRAGHLKLVLTYRYDDTLRGFLTLNSSHNNYGLDVIPIAFQAAGN